MRIGDPRQKWRAIRALFFAAAGGAIAASPAAAVGALAVGSCGAFGSGWDYSSEVLAHGAALTNCPDSSCQIHLTVRRACVALAYDPNSCAWGANTADNLQAAQNAAISACYQYGGQTCVVRTSFCDSAGE